MFQLSSSYTVLLLDTAIYRPTHKVDLSYSAFLSVSFPLAGSILLQVQLLSVVVPFVSDHSLLPYSEPRSSIVWNVYL